MSTNHIFRRRKHDAVLSDVPYHPKKDPRYTEPISTRALQDIFANCADFMLRDVAPGGKKDVRVSVCWLDGLVSVPELAADVLRPLTDAARLSDAKSPAECEMQLLEGAVWAGTSKRRSQLDDLVADLLHGCCAVIFDSLGEGVSFEIKNSAVRPVSTPTVEKSVKGGKDAFVETLRINTALVRRRVRDSALKMEQLTVGRKSATTVAILYLDGVANPETLEELRRRLDSIDIDGLITTGSLEQYIVDRPLCPFPQLLHTERSDRFAAELLAGRIGVLADGLPLGFLLPATLPQFMKVAEDSAQHFLVACGLTMLRWFSMALTTLFPALFVAVGVYHQEMIPTKLLLSMIESKQRVPFSIALEVLMMLIAFELLMEAGIRLPNPVGDTVSIIGALIVGQSAVDARVVSPVAVIVVATAAICGFTQPSRDMGIALRLLRVLMVLMAITLGMFGIALGTAALVWYLCTIENFGVAYISPLDRGGMWRITGAMLRPPLFADKLRERALHTPDRRNQK